MKELNKYDQVLSVCPCCHSNDVWEKDSDYNEEKGCNYSLMECLTCGSKYADYYVEMYVGTEVKENNYEY